MLIINGINTWKGGSGAHLLITWTRSLDKHGKKYDVFHTVPAWPKVNVVLRTGLLALYFLPGTLFRVFRFPLFELAYKFSPWLLLRCFLYARKREQQSVLLSHHAIFYLGYLFRPENTRYIIHDLLYRRTRSLGFSRRLSRFAFWVECRLYCRPASLFCLSTQEARILKRFGFQRVQLLSTYPVDIEICPPASYDLQKIAAISDWRRPENRHGIAAFFQRQPLASRLNKDGLIHCFIYGFQSVLIEPLFTGLSGEDSDFRVEIMGFYKDHSSIPEGVFLIPIYQGAGIKIKLLEALRHRRFVLGTPAAFEGLPRHWLMGVSSIVHSIDDVANLSIDVDPKAFERFEERYKERFIELGNVNFSRHLDMLSHGV